MINPRYDSGRYSPLSPKPAPALQNRYHLGHMVRVLIAVSWLIVLVMLAEVMRLPRVMDIYIKDHYFVVPRIVLITGMLVLFILPLAVSTVRQFRTQLH